MAISAVLSTLLVTALMLGASLGDNEDCLEAAQELNACVLSNTLDVNRLGDPSYHPEMCSAMRGMVECVEEAGEQCRAMQNHAADSIAVITTQLETLCPNVGVTDSDEDDDDVGYCNDLAKHVMTCARTLENAAKNCRSVDDALDCLDDVQERCEGTPQLRVAQQHLVEIVDTLNTMKRYYCNEDD